MIPIDELLFFRGELLTTSQNHQPVLNCSWPTGATLRSLHLQEPQQVTAEEPQLRLMQVLRHPPELNAE